MFTLEIDVHFSTLKFLLYKNNYNTLIFILNSNTLLIAKSKHLNRIKY